MTQVIRRRDPLSVIADSHRRIRRIEAEPGGGSDPTVCPDCVLDPFTVNPEDITVPEAYRECVDVGGAFIPFDTVCGVGLTTLVPETDFGFCSAYALGKPMALQINIFADFGSNPSNMQNIIVYAGISGSIGQVFAKGWEPAGNPGDAGGSYSSGWVTANQLCGGSCQTVAIAAAFTHHNTFSGGCVLGGILAARWVVLNDDDEYRGALDQLPPGEAFGDVIYFNSDTHEFVEGPRSLPSRAMSTFMGG